MDKDKAKAVVRKALQLDEVACDVIGWRDAMAEKAEVPLCP